MNGQPAMQPELRQAPRWTARLDECRPEAPPAAAAWLAEPGLLTERLRACCNGQTGLTVVSEADAPLAAQDAEVLQAAGNAAFVREIELTCDGRPWVFAQTLIPQATLAHQRWLSVARPRRARRTPRRRARARARAARVRAPRRRRSLSTIAHCATARTHRRHSGRAAPGSRSRATASWCRKCSCPKRTRERAPTARRSGLQARSGSRIRCATRSARSAGRCASTPSSCACTSQSGSGCCSGRRCGDSGSRATAGPIREFSSSSSPASS